jgi:7,8-dihydropterin-6-yl-methyl-4-(beta-D-ribofuranosyl)aminobenzene 5'-phosphate synthase
MMADLIAGAMTPDSPASGVTRITIVYNNVEESADLQTDWGFSALIERDTLEVLFDTGMNGEILLSNMQRLGIDPARLDMIVISHAHFDHTGGLGSLLPETEGNPTLVLCTSFHEQFAQAASDAGCSTIEVGREAVELMPGLLSTGEMGTAIPEQGVVIDTQEGWVLLTGCAHPGIIEMTERALAATGDNELRLVAGGFHLMHLGMDEALQTAGRMQELGVTNVSPSHCTGDLARDAFLQSFEPECFHSGGAGWVVSL